MDIQDWTDLSGNLELLQPFLGRRVTVQKMMTNRVRMYVPVGYVCSGSLSIVKRNDAPSFLVSGPGDYVLSSTVKDVTKDGEDSFLIMTKNSVYRLVV